MLQVPQSQKALLGVVTAVVVLGAVGYVALSLQRPEPASFAPSPTDPAPAGDRLVGPVRYTVDAQDPNEWQFFSFAQGTVVVDPRPYDWDLAFRRFQIIVNGGNGFRGLGGVVPVGRGGEEEGAEDEDYVPPPLDSLRVLPEDGYLGTEVARGDSVSLPLEDWYSYSFLSHLLTPRPEVFALRTADGRYAALRFLSYYCLGAQPGCVTFEYLYQGGGGPRLRD